MPTFKRSAPGAHSTPKLKKTSLKSMKKKDTTKHFSIVDFVDLNRNGSVFINGSEEQFLNVVKKSKTIKRNFRSAEEEVKRLKQNEQQWLKERDALRCQLKQAQQLFNQENAEKRQIVKETEILQRYSSVPNRRIGPNKRAGGKILKKNIKSADRNKAVQGGFFSQN